MDLNIINKPSLLHFHCTSKSMSYLSLDHRVAAGQQFNLLQISVVVGVWFLGPRIHISGSHQPSGDLGPSPCPLWSFRGPAAARTRSRPRHCRSLWVGTIIIIQMSGSQIIKLRKMCGHWAMITWVPRRPRRPPRNAAVQCTGVILGLATDGIFSEI